MAVCKQCGAQLGDGVKFCNKCGTPVEAASSTGADAGNGFNASEIGEKVGDVANGVANKGKELFNDNIKGFSSKDQKNQMTIIAVIAVVVVVLFGCFVWSGTAPKRTAKKYLKVVQKMDADKLEKMAPKFYKDYLEEEDIDFDEVDKFAYYSEEYGDDLKIETKIKKIKKVKKDDIKDFKEAIDDEWDVKAKFKKAYQVKFEYKIKAEDDDLEYLETSGWQKSYLLVVKEGFSWKVIETGMSIDDFTDMID